MKLCIFFGVTTKQLFGGSFIYISGLFLKFKVQNWNIFLGIAKFQTFFRVPYIPDIFFGKQ